MLLVTTLRVVTHCPDAPRPFPALSIVIRIPRTRSVRAVRSHAERGNESERGRDYGPTCGNR